MKRKELSKRIAAITLSSMVAGNFLTSASPIYAESLTPMANDEVEVEKEVRSSDYSVIGAVESFNVDGNIVNIKMVTGEQVRVSLLDENVLRVYMDPTGKFQEDPTPNGEDHITKILDKRDEDYKGVTPTIEDGDILKISTSLVELRVEKETGKMELVNKETGESIWKEAEPLKYANNETIQTLEAKESEYFYGGGMQNGRFSHKGKAIQIKNTNKWEDGGVTSPTPFYWSTNGYGVMRHTFKPGEYDFESLEKGKVIAKHQEKRFDAYYFVADTAAGIINEFTELTGKPILMPEYAFYLGHANCYARDWINDETGQESQTQKPGFDRQETLMVDAKKVVDDHVNTDTPIGWFLPNDGYGCGYGREDSIDGNIANLKEFVDYTKDKGIKTGLWTESNLKPVGNQEVYLERDIEKEVGVAGTVGVKTDVAWVGQGYSFALNSVRQSAEGIMNNSTIDARPFVVTVDGWAGTQRYSTVWSGDQTGGKWEYIRFHIPTYIGASLSGQPNVGSDMDGIFGGKQPVIQTRDFQWKAFTPVQIDMDGWGTTAKNPYAFGEPYTSINRMYLKLKAEMMPYNYTIANEASNDGLPMIRAMMLEYPNEYTYGTKTQYQYMWGPNMLVAPIYQNTESDASGNDIRNDIYLPDEDQVWIDYFTGEQYKGGKVINNFETPVWKLPLFVKNGAIIPMSNENNSPEFIDDSKRIYEIYPSGETSFEVYEDDGITNQYKSGQTATTLITSSAPKEGKGTAVITVGKLTGDYEGIVTDRSTEFIVNVSEKPSTLEVAVGDEKVELKEAKTIEEYNNGSNMYFYNQAPDLNKYATEGTEFADIEIKTTPKVYVKVEETNAKANEVKLTVNEFVNAMGEKEVVDQEAPQVPTNLRVANVSDQQIDIAWDAVEGDNVTYDLMVDGVLYTDVKAPFSDTGLAQLTEHSYKVRATNTKGSSEWSEEIKASTIEDLLKYSIKPENMSGKASNSHPSRQPANALDGDLKTEWWGQWTKDGVPATFVITMDSPYELDKFDYVGNEAGAAGNITKFNLSYSLDGENYKNVITEGVWEDDGKAKTIKFNEPIVAKYIKIEALEGKGDYAIAREFIPYKVPGTDKILFGDYAPNGKIEEDDVRYLSKYLGTKNNDTEWDYIKKADVNYNNYIDAYDVAFVSRMIGSTLKPTTRALNGKINLIPSKVEDIKAGEEITVTISGTSLSDMYAFDAFMDINSEKYELVLQDNIAVKPEALTSNMINLSLTKNDNTKLAIGFTSRGNSKAITGSGDLATIKLRAKVDTDFDLNLEEANVTGTRMNSKGAKGVVASETPPSLMPVYERVPREDKSAYAKEEEPVGGCNSIIDGDIYSYWHAPWYTMIDPVDKQYIGVKFNEPTEVAEVKVYQNQSTWHGILKKYELWAINGDEEFKIGEGGTPDSKDVRPETFDFRGKEILADKIEVRVKESHNAYVTLGEIEVIRKNSGGVEVEDVQLDSNNKTEIVIGEKTEFNANVLPATATNQFVQVESSNPEVARVILNKVGDNYVYTIKGISEGKATITATSIDGEKVATTEISVKPGEEEIIVQKPSSLKAEVTSTDAKLTWEAPESTVGLVGYIIYKDGKLVEEVGAGVNEFKVEGLKNNTIYGFKVVTKYSNGEKSKPISINVRTNK